MKTKLIAALLAASALTAAPTFADGVKFTGDLYIGAGSQTGTDGNVDDLDPFFVGGKGSLFLPLDNPKLSLTFDLFVEHGAGVVDLFGAPGEEDFTSFGGAAHFTFTQGKRYSLGLVGSIFAAEAPPVFDPEYYLFAAEGKFMLERGSIWGQVGYFDTFDDDTFGNNLTETSFAYVGVNYYLDDNTRLGAATGFFDGQVELTDPAPFTIYRVELEHKVFENASIYGAYQYLSMDNTDEDDNVQSNVFNVGVKFRWGDNDTGTLMSHEQTNSLGVPPVLHAIGLSNRFD